MSKATPVERIKSILDREVGLGAPEKSEEEIRRYDRPAIGLLATSENASDVAATILRATNEGYETLVAYADDSTSEAVHFAQQLGAIIVDAGRSYPVKQRLVRAARTRGFPGLIYVSDPGHRFHVGRLEGQLSETSQYVVEATQDRIDSSTTRLIAGIPAYNEAVSIGSIVVNTLRYVDEVIVVDDGSTDATAKIAEEAGASVIQHEGNRGKGAALQTILDEATTLDPDVLVLLDGDGQHYPDDIPELVNPILNKEADIVIGNRYFDGSSHETPGYRRFGQRVLDVLTIGSARMNISDSQSGFRALSAAAIHDLELQSQGYEVESEMIQAAADDGLDIEEQPIDVRYDGLDGSSANPLAHGLSIVTFMLQLIRDRHPLLFFGVPGTTLTLVGFAYGVDGYLFYLSTGQFYPVKAIGSSFLILIGILGIFTGFVLNRMSNFLNQISDRV